MSAEKFLRELEQPAHDRRPKTIYLSRQLVADAEKKAPGISISRLIEALLREFIKRASK